MTTRTDVIVDFNPSPRIAEVDAPSTEIILQDIVDTLRKREEGFDGMAFTKLINASGKEALGGGVLVGITAELQDTLIAFKARTTPAETGTVTTASTAPITGTIRLIDSAATFVTNNVIRGSLVVNFTDNSINDVFEVISETELKVLTLVNGVGNNFGIGDVYHVFNIVQVKVTGGNLVAVDKLDITISPVLPTAFTQVITTASSSATLQEQADVQFSSFGGGVSVDTSSSFIGTIFPVGTPRQPVNNYTDARTIALARGFSKFFVVGNPTLDTGDDVSNFTLQGVNDARTNITVNTGSNVAGVEILDATVSGTFDVTASFEHCTLMNIQFVEAEITNCILAGKIVLAGTGTTTIVSCNDGVVSAAPPPEIDFGGSGRGLSIRDYNGDILLSNKTGAESVEINVSTGGTITIANTVTNGTIRLTGILEVVDNSVSPAIIDTGAVIFPDLMQLAAFDNHILIDPINGTAGTKFPQGTHQNPVNNLVDAKTIMSVRKINNIAVEGTLVIGATDNIDNFTLIGTNTLNSVVSLTAGASTDRTTFKNMILAGTVNGSIHCISVALQSLSGIGSDTFPTIFERCIPRSGTITLKSGLSTPQNIHFIECVSGSPGTGQIILDVNGSNSPWAFRKYDGGLTVRNFTAGNQTTFDGDPGRLTLEVTCTSGTIVIGGIVDITDNSAVGFTVLDPSSLSPEIITNAVWSAQITNFSPTIGSVAEFIVKKLLTLKKFVAIRKT